MKKFLFCLLTIGLIFTGCDRLVKIQTYDFDIDGTVTKEQVKDAILSGCKNRGWTTKEKDENTISAKLLSKGTYGVYVDIVYDITNYKILYVDSVNMNATDNRQTNFINSLYDSIDSELFKFNIDGTLTDGQMKTAIFAGCENEDWIAEEKGGNTISAKLLKKDSYEIFVDIVYGNSKYKIEYVKSNALGAANYLTEQKINKAYDNWINYLHRSIDEELFKTKW